MNYPHCFVYAGPAYSERDAHVPAPLMRRAFTVRAPRKATLLITGLGFYDLWLNGARITKGMLAPYISAPSDLVFYDCYELGGLLREGENVLGVVLGNGLMNDPGGYVWDFDTAPWRGAPRMALRLDIEEEDGETYAIESDAAFRTAPSAIRFDDYRYGEVYDAREATPGWSAPGFDDGHWQPAVPCERPVGEARLCACEPVRVVAEIVPVRITPQDDGWLYDFGVNESGVCRLSIEGEAGQTVELYHGELLTDGRLDTRNIKFQHRYEDDEMVQRDIYICAGGGPETYTPTFAYHGFRYVLVRGITQAQATPALLTFLVAHSDLAERGGFSCADPIANALQEITRRSDLSNFFYFPNDCPQREKNGWTADAALSCEHMLMNLAPERSYHDWLANIRAAQRADGALPGIVPTGGWGFHWGNGPAWDNVLFLLPYFTYKYRGDMEIIRENAGAMLRYLQYIGTRADADGLLAIGLGDWCPVGREADAYKAPLRVTDTILTADMAEKAAAMFGAVGLHRERTFALSMHADLHAAVRRHLIDLDTMTVEGACQTSQAMGLYYGMFEPGERSAAFANLLCFIDEQDGHMDVGVLGGRVIFHVLAAFDQADLAYRMITREDYPSYGNWIKRGATTLWEMFFPEGMSRGSLNHHFWGDISGWFIQAIAGIRVNPRMTSCDDIDIRPAFIDDMDDAEGFHIAPAGRVAVRWARTEAGVDLTLEYPEGARGNIVLPAGYAFADGMKVKPAVAGTYEIAGL